MRSSSVEEVADLLDAAFEALAAVDLDALPDGELLALTGELGTAQNRLAAQMTRVVRKAENRQSAEHDGLKSMRSWLRTHTRITDPAARRLIDTGRALECLPATEAAFAAGTIGAEQVTAITPVVSP